MAKTNKLLSVLCVVLAVMLLISMAPSGTFAWFTDNVTNENSKIQAGTLDIALYQMDKTKGWTDISRSTEPLFNNTLWEPGYTDVKVLKVKNDGTLALEWSASLNHDGEISALADVIDVYVTTGEITAYPTRDEVKGWLNAGTLAQFIDGFAAATKGNLKAGEEAYLGIALHMQESAGNEYQNLDLGGVFDIAIYATQDTVESDAFDNNYDADHTVVVNNSKDLADAISDGKEVVLSGDVAYKTAISKDASIDLGGNTFEATNTIELANDADLAMTGGDYTVNSTYGHIDVRPTSGEGSVVTYKDVNFSFNKLNNTYGPSTNRLGSVLEFCAATADAKAVIVFKNCMFNNAQVVFEGMSGKTGEFEAIFENCTFNALTSSAPIYVQNYVKGTIKVVNCTFNLTCTSSSASAISVSSSTSTAVEVTAENNTFNAVAATPYTYDASKGEDATYNVKVNGTPANIKFISIGGTTSTAIETGTVKTGIAAK